MKRNYYKRNAAEVQRDKEFSADLWKRGYNIIEIAKMLEEEHERLNTPYSLSYRSVSGDIKDIIEQTRKLKQQTGINDLEELLERYEYLYNEAIISHRISPMGGHLTTAVKVLDHIAKLKGLSVEKAELYMKVKYDIDIE